VRRLAGRLTRDEDKHESGTTHVRRDRASGWDWRVDGEFCLRSLLGHGIASTYTCVSMVHMVDLFEPHEM